MKIALLDDYYQRAHRYADWSKLDFADIQFFSEYVNDQQKLVDMLKDHDAVGLMRERTPFPAELIEQLPKLKLIVTSGKKNASIDVKAANARGITVCGTESPGHATAELALLLIMAVQRQLVPLVTALREQGAWQPHMGKDLKDKTLGVLGLGRLGGRLAGYAQALGMNVIAWSENLQAAHCESLGVRHVTREALFSESDFVSIHLRHSDRTHAMVNLEDLRRLGPEGYLVNTSRAEIVDSSALREALDQSLIAGLATDVHEQEPTPADDWLVHHPRVLATPHVGYCTEETFRVFYQQMADAFIAFHQGNPIRVIDS